MVNDEVKTEAVQEAQKNNASADEKKNQSEEKNDNSSVVEANSVVVLDNYITEDLIKEVATSQNVKPEQVKVVLKLVEEGATVPFIARYRKEVTGNLNEDEVRAITKEWEYGKKLQERKQDVMRLIEERGKLTKELVEEIQKATKLSEVEDIYRPYKEKKKTRATDAKKKGLEPLALWLLSCPMEPDPKEEAKKYVTPKEQLETVPKDTVVKNVEEALQGAEDIIAEIISDNAQYRKWIRSYFERRSEIKTEVKDPKLDSNKKYEMYYDYQEPVKDIKPHRVLAINRAENEKVLRVSLVEDSEVVYNFINRRVLTNEASPAVPYIKLAIDDSYKRLIKPSIEREVRAELKEVAEDESIRVFSKNLKNYLFTPPMKNLRMLGVDPAYRTGCKLAVVDENGTFLEKGVIYPHPKNEKERVPEERLQEAEQKVASLIKKYNINLLAIGNGTASRETESFVANLLKKYMEIDPKTFKDVNYIIVNEAGASVYSAGEIAQQEFPDFSVEERSAVSIARRVQDPLSELIKIDPKSIGVGQYQHDVSQAKLSDSLDFVVSSAVNSVGVDLNSASVPLLQRVSGLSVANAKAIVTYRNENGAFKTREDLKNVKSLGVKILEQAVGFLRIIDGKEKFDMTPIHPESYEKAALVLKKLGFAKKDIGTEELKAKVMELKKDKEEFKKLLSKTEIGEFTLTDILDALAAPQRDPRDEYPVPILRKDVLSLKDIQVGMELDGTVRNVIDFGAFVDCGVKVDGLIHTSQMKKKYSEHPSDVLNVGDIVHCYVVSVDYERQRLGLSLFPPKEK